MLVRGGGGIGGLLAVIALLYFSGAGAWLLQRIQALPDQCYSGISSIGISRVTSAAGPICGGIGKAVNGLTDVSNHMGEKLNGLKQHLGFAGHFQGLNGFGGSMQQTFAGLSSSADRLKEMVEQGPRQISSGSLNQQFQRGVDSFTIGQQYASGGDAASAVPWLQQGARQPQGFGLMSQLSLGDLYRNGGNGVAPDPMQSQAYYQLAQNSLAQLSQSNTPQAQQLLGALPVSPQAMQQELGQAINSVKMGGRR